GRCDQHDVRAAHHRRCLVGQLVGATGGATEGLRGLNEGIRAHVRRLLFWLQMKERRNVTENATKLLTSARPYCASAICPSAQKSAAASFRCIGPGLLQRPEGHTSASTRPGVISPLHRRMLAMPVRRLLIGVACLYEQGLVKMPPDKLERERQASRREAAWQSNSRAAGHVERRCKASKL